jgi:hypothetical protein
MNIKQIAEARDKIEARVLTEGYITTERDLAEARELVSAYIDELERLENTVSFSKPLTDIEKVAEKIIEVWHP